MSEQEEIKVTGGIGAFFFAAIPWILGCAAVVWLGFFTGIIQFRHQQSAYRQQQTVQQRMDNRVGVTAPLKEPVKLIILPRHGCIKIEKAFLDGSRMTVYLHSNCQTFMDYYQLHTVGRSPDRTIVWSDYENTSSLPSLQPGDTGEWSMDVSQDQRISAIEIWTQDTQ